MSDDDNSTIEAPTRRDYVKYGGAVVGGGLLAGCAGQPDSGSTPSENESEVEQGGDDSTEGETSYEVCMEPNGCHTLAEIPETYAVYDPAVIGMMIALGQEDGVIAEQGSGYPTEYLEQLPEVSFDGRNLTALIEDGESPDKELFYELDADIHLIDHYTAQGYFEFSEEDIAELEDNVGPFHGSWMRRSDWTDDHPFYDLYEGLNTFAEVFQAEERGQAFEEFYDEMVAEVTSQLPPVEDRPSMGYLTTSFDDKEVIYLRHDGDGYQYKPFQALETYEHDAFEGLYGEGEALSETTYRGDFEVLLEADPDVVIHHNAMASFRDPDTDWFEDTLEPLKNDPVAGEVSAYQNDRAYPWHETYAAGPIVMMFETELIAKSIYPDVFGEPTGLEEPPEDEQLFDRQRLADIINGDL
ncbi:ABC transporter substrate-binding protein [Halomarina ordinaria]|uniref:ABC transporter substrate-binding protein n=1 Tax=Halomarina ordinaria TaxID=3033939 RepID=A0ABD5UCC3_9EURY|nr:ABC transporter substrate-binding protein [Halomarina sp. PSRA2]